MTFFYRADSNEVPKRLNYKYLIKTWNWTYDGVCVKNGVFTRLQGVNVLQIIISFKWQERTGDFAKTSTRYVEQKKSFQLFLKWIA